MKKPFIRLNIALIGSGKIAENLAHGFLLAGHEIIFGTESDDFTISRASIYTSQHVQVMPIEDAGILADVIIMCCPPEEIRASAYFLNEVKHKIIIDCVACPGIIASPNHVYLHSLNAIKSITGSQQVVKWLYSSDNKNPPRKIDYSRVKMFVAGDSLKAKIVTRLLANDLGCPLCYDLGGNDKVGLLEHLAESRKRKQKTRLSKLSLS